MIPTKDFPLKIRNHCKSIKQRKQLTCGRIQTTFFFRVNVRGVGGKSRSSCRPFTPRDSTPLSCLPFPCNGEPLVGLNNASVDDRGREIVEI